VASVCRQPFWPIGSGCARGFLGALDTAWMIRSWASGKMTPLEVIAERESIYQLLSQTTPENLNKSFAQHTIDPNTRSVRPLPAQQCASFRSFIHLCSVFDDRWLIIYLFIYLLLRQWQHT